MQRTGERGVAEEVATMCGRFDTSHMTWSDIHAALSSF
jgi:hypothetical protein